MKNPTLCHYTGLREYESILTGKGYGKTGLHPIKRFIPLCDGKGLPEKVYDCVIFGLLEPNPESWINNTEFNNIWDYLLGDITSKSGKTVLLKAKLQPTDDAFVVDRGCIERVLYVPSDSRYPDKNLMREAYKKYWNSRVPVFDYEGGHSLPELVVFSPIELSRIQLQWIKDSDELYKNVLKRNVA